MGQETLGRGNTGAHSGFCLAFDLQTRETKHNFRRTRLFVLFQYGRLLSLTVHLKKQTLSFIKYTKDICASTCRQTNPNTFSNGCLGSYIDEERSEMRYVMRIAKPASHQNFERNLHFLRGVCLLECLFIPTTIEASSMCAVHHIQIQVI
jgi:hypothetical protein